MDDHIELALAERDPRLGALVERVIAHAGRRRFATSTARSHFEALARSIVYQQLSGKAAATIYGRFSAALGGDVTPSAVLATTDAELRALGLSVGKARYVRALAEAVEAGQLDLEHASSLDDDAVVRALTSVKGIGVWTAQMFLMFRLQRPDVLPTRDLGIQKGLSLAHGLKKVAAPGYVERAGAKWAPYRSVACLYLWAGLELPK